jgi:hypothetical protein
MRRRWVSAGWVGGEPTVAAGEAGIYR